MDIGATLYVTTRVDFRTWLAANHQTKEEIWLIQYKKHTKKPSLTLAEAVEEAMCFGWTESNGFKALDTERYVTRFTPRRATSNWSERNRERARRMIAAGKMTEAGFATLPADIQVK